MAAFRIGRSTLGSLRGTTGSDVFEFTEVPVGALTLDGLTSTLNNAGIEAAPGSTASTVAAAALLATDARLSLSYRPGVAPATASGTDTNATRISGYNAEDVLLFSKSGDYSGLESFFSNIETVRLASGVRIILSSEIFESVESYADRGALNTGIRFEGVAGGPTEKVTFRVEFEVSDESLFTPAVGDAYIQVAVELDDYSQAQVFSNVQPVFDARDFLGDDDDEPVDGVDSASLGRYFRFDGANESGGEGEIIYGCNGVDYSTLRLGNDTHFSFDGNDRLIGHGGADYLDGGSGNDLFEIGGFGTRISGTSGKGDDGKAEWIISASEAARVGVTNGITNAADYGNKIDVIVGGAGTDTLRITSGIGATNSANGTIVLNNENFQQMERVEVGGAVSRDPDESAFQQLRDGHLYFARSSSVSDLATSAGGTPGNSINNVVVDASGVTKSRSGLTFEGNANTQKFIGTTRADVFIGNEGADTLTGGCGADKFVFQTIREYARDSSTANGVIAYTPTDEAFDATDADVITDFLTGTDKIVFRVEATTALEDTFDSLVALSRGDLTATNVLIGDLTAIDTAGTANHFIKADTTGSDVKVYYDADGNGAGAAVLVATLTGVATVVAGDFRVEAVQGF